MFMDKTDPSCNVDSNMKLSYIVCGEMRMIRKTVAMDEDLVRELDIFAKKEHRDFSSALRYTLRIGLLAVENPELTVQEIKDILEALVDYEMGNVSDLDLKDL
jgi:metal-responsive CopG/Arc/MetJ family transcriptional regulator